MGTFTRGPYQGDRQPTVMILNSSLLVISLLTELVTREFFSRLCLLYLSRLSSVHTTTEKTQFIHATARYQLHVCSGVATLLLYPGIASKATLNPWHSVT